MSADHLSGMAQVKREVGGSVAIGNRIDLVQRSFKEVFGLSAIFRWMEPVDRLFADDEGFFVGSIPARVLHTPGHTPACVPYLIGDAVFVGDTLFMPDAGTARADFPGGDAAELYRSIRRILALAPERRMSICHDYGPGGRKPAWETTVARAGHEHPCAGRDFRGGVRGAADRARQEAGNAGADHSGGSGEYPGRRVAAGVGEWRALSAGAGERPLTLVLGRSG